MHKLLEYICDELEEFERKADKEGKLSMAEMQYVDLLAHTKKNLLKAEEMMGEEGEYSMESYARGRSNEGGSYARNRGGNQGGGSSRRSYERGGSYARGRNARRDSMGRYSREDGYSGDQEEMVEELRQLMEDAPDDRTRQEFQKFIQKIEQM